MGESVRRVSASDKSLQLALDKRRDVVASLVCLLDKFWQVFPNDLVQNGLLCLPRLIDAGLVWHGHGWWPLQERCRGCRCDHLTASASQDSSRVIVCWLYDRDPCRVLGHVCAATIVVIVIQIAPRGDKTGTGILGDHFPLGQPDPGNVGYSLRVRVTSRGPLDDTGGGYPFGALPTSTPVGGARTGGSARPAPPVERAWHRAEVKRAWRKSERRKESQ